MTKKKFLILSFSEKKYIDDLFEIIKGIEKSHRICYVCLSRLYKDVLTEMKKHKLDTSNFFFIDTLSSYYEKHKKTSKCTYVSSPSDIEDLKESIKSVIERNKCDIIIFDTISTLLIYKKIDVIVKLTHEILNENQLKKTKTVYIMLEISHAPKTELERMTDDLSMFADDYIRT